MRQQGSVLAPLFAVCNLEKALVAIKGTQHSQKNSPFRHDGSRGSAPCQSARCLKPVQHKFGVVGTLARLTSVGYCFLEFQIP